MKKTSWPIIICLVTLTGCAHHYVLTLNNGTRITTASKPQLKDGCYWFKDAKGEEHFVAESRVHEVAPASVAARENKSQTVQGGTPKKRHWYLLWLG